jgi:CRP-like cAMP-binding protein
MAKTNPALEHLGKVRLFQGLTPKELAAIGALAKTFTFPAGSVIVEEGAQGGRFYLITAGEADVIVHDQSVLTLREGGYFGEIALIDEGPRTATVRAITEVEALGIASFNFRPLLKNEPGVAFKILQEVCRRLRDADRMQSV